MGSSTVPASGGGKQPYSQAFYSSGTWTKPAGVNTATVTCIGGGGGSYYASATIGGGGGGGYIKTTVDVSAISTATVTIGAGGVSTDTAANVTSGSSSSFGTLVYAHGGEGRTPAVNSVYVNGGVAVAQDSGTAENTQNVADGISRARWQVLSTSARTTANAWLSTNDYAAPAAQSIAYNGTNLYVSTANVTNEIWTSSNAITWTKNTTTTGTVQNIGWNGTYFVMVPAATGTTAYYGTNGTSWTTAALPSSITWTGSVTTGTLSVAYSAASTTAAYSTNGTTWAASTLPVAMNSNTGMYVANGRIYFASSTGQTYYTTNGTTWTTAGTTTNSAVFTYNTSSATYMAWSYGNYNATANYFTSTDGVAWTSRAVTLMPVATWRSGSPYSGYSCPVVIDDRWFAFAYTTGASGYSTTATLLSSTNGTSWTIVKYWSKGLNTTTAKNVFPHFYQSIVSAGTGRYQVYFHDNSGTNSNLSTLLWSRFATGGMQGQMHVSAQNSGVPFSSYSGSAGAASSRGDVMYNAINVAGGNGQNQYVVYGAGLGIDGYCKGGTGPTNWDNGQNYNNNIGNLNYGDGAPVYNGAPNGGNGLVIVEWWA